jgi:hypothetical protein
MGNMIFSLKFLNKIKSKYARVGVIKILLLETIND